MNLPLPPLSLCWLTVRDAHPFEHVEAAVAGGFDAVGLRLVPPQPGDPLLPVVGNEPLVRELLARLRTHNVSVQDVETVWIGPGLDIAGLLPVFDLAQRLGCHNLLCMGQDPETSRLTDTFAALCNAAAGFGLDVGLEFAAYTCVGDIHAAQRLVTAADRPNGRILIDALHLARSGGTPADVALLPRASLAYCQLADARGPRPADNAGLMAEARGRRWQPGEGDLPLAALMQALPGLPVGVEVPQSSSEALPVIDRARAAGAATRAFFRSIGLPA